MRLRHRGVIGKGGYGGIKYSHFKTLIMKRREKAESGCGCTVKKKGFSSLKWERFEDV